MPRWWYLIIQNYFVFHINVLIKNWFYRYFFCPSDCLQVCTTINKNKKLLLFLICSVWYSSSYFAISSSLSTRASPMPAHLSSICYPAFHLLHIVLSHSYCQHSYQSVPCFNLVSHFCPLPLSPDVLKLVAQPWHSDSFLRQRSDFLVTQLGNNWLILLLSSSGPQCAILWVSEGPM